MSSKSQSRLALWYLSANSNGRRVFRRVRWFALLSSATLLGDCGPPGAAARADRQATNRVSFGRLSGSPGWSPCDTERRDAPIGAVRCNRFALREPSGNHAIASQWAATDHDQAPSRRDDSWRAEHARATTDLQWSTTAPGALDRAVATLRNLSERYPEEPAILSDLSVALLLDADRTHRLRPALEALDAAARGRQLAPRDPTITTNLAVILEFLRLPDAAYEAWGQALSLEPDAQWREELTVRKARVRRVLDAARGLGSVDSVMAVTHAPDSSLLEQSAATAPQWGRDVGWSMLGRWGSCTQRADIECAARALGVARVIARAETARGGDLSIARIVALVDSVADTPTVEQRGLASALDQFSYGLALYRRGDFSRAHSSFRSAAARLRGSAAGTEHWLQYYVAGALVNRGEYDRARLRLLPLIASRVTGLPVLAGKARLALGVIEGRRGDTDRAIAWYRSAVPDLEQARDAETQGFAAFLLAETFAVQGRRVESHAEAMRSMRLNFGFRSSATLRSQLTQLATLAREERLPFAALAISHESVAIARGLGRASDLALALCDRSRALLVVGLDSLALRDLDSADTWAMRLEGASGLDRVRAYVELGRGEVLRSQSPRRSIESLTHSVNILRKFGTDVFLPVALHQAALSLIAVGDTLRAEQLLVEAVNVLEAQNETFQSSANRASFAENVEQIFDTMIELQLNRSKRIVALEFLERSRRSAYRPSASRRATRISSRPIGSILAVQRALPERAVVLEYAVLRDRLAIWSISRDSVALVTVPISRQALARKVGDFESAGAVHAGTSNSAAGAFLFELLLRPVLDSIPTGFALVIVPDRELFRVSFAGLWDESNRAHVVERYLVQYAPSADVAARSLRVRAHFDETARILAVGNDAGDTTAPEQLPALAHAEREARDVARLYRNSTLLAGPALSRASLQTRLRTAEILHFAGHSVFDQSNPERSFLLIAGRGDSTRFLAREIAVMRPSRLRLVILSACRTLNARSSRVGPVSGLAYSFLQAGASGTITSLWNVDDAATSEFMSSLHRHLLAGRSPADALRQVQLEFVRSPELSLRSPYVWAGFTLTGA